MAGNDGPPVWLPWVIVAAIVIGALYVGGVVVMDQRGADTGSVSSSRSDESSIDRDSPEYNDAYEAGLEGAHIMGGETGEEFCGNLMLSFFYANGGFPPEQEKLDRNVGCREGWKSERPDDTSVDQQLREAERS
jgi:hypothetical protein